MFIILLFRCHYALCTGAGIMEVRGSHVQVQEGYPKQVWQSLESSITSTTDAGGGVGESVRASEDRVMHHIVKVDRCATCDDLVGL